MGKHSKKKKLRPTGGEPKAVAGGSVTGTEYHEALSGWIRQDLL